MGSELGLQFNRLFNECAWLHLKWQEFVALFGTKPSRLDLMNQSAHGFFSLVQTLLWEDVLVHICKLTDNPEVGKRRRETLSVRRLPRLVEPAIKKRIQTLVSHAVKRCEFARDWRDRQIVHMDLRHAIDQRAVPLASASRNDVREAIAAIVAVLDAVEDHYCRMTTAYAFVSQLGDATALLYVLRSGIAARKQQHSRVDFDEEPL
jgi:hypothetical protein